MIQKKDLRTLSLTQTEALMKEIGEKPYRAKQVQEWLWRKSARSISEMSNLSKDLRTELENRFEILPIKIEQFQKSQDGTIKNRFQLHDDHFIEGVIIPTPKRKTACISSQVGCSLSCKFCATGFLKRERNLTAGEIYDQVVFMNQQSQKYFDQNLSNIVYMGMGEPLLNYANVIQSIGKITTPNGLAIAPKRITVSTAGVAKMIKKLADDAVKVNLALSLHAANDSKRNQIMPINETNNLTVLADALNYYYRKTNNRITFEYIMFQNFNDSKKDANELVEFAKKVPCKINIIEYNPIDNAQFERASDEKTNQFAKFLLAKKLFVTVRKSRGKDIDAACGQLANK